MSELEDFRQIVAAWVRRRNPTESFTLNQIANFALGTGTAQNAARAGRAIHVFRIYFRESGYGNGRKLAPNWEALRRDHPDLDEERVAARALLDELAQAVKRRITAEEVGEQLGGRFRAQWKQRQLMIVRPLHPSSVVLGAEVEQQQTTVSGGGFDHVLEECLA